MRRLELIKLKLFDLDPERGAVMIRQDKGKKDLCGPEFLRRAPRGTQERRWRDTRETQRRRQICYMHQCTLGAFSPSIKNITGT